MSLFIVFVFIGVGIALAACTVGIIVAVRSDEAEVLFLKSLDRVRWTICAGTGVAVASFLLEVFS